MELTQSEEIRRIIESGNGTRMTLPEIIAEEIRDFYASPQFTIMEEAEQYYRNRSSVQGKTTKYKDRSNTKIEHPILRKLVDQKANYLLSKPFSVESENPAYAKSLSELFDSRFRQQVKSLGKGAVKSGIAWLAPYFEDSTLKWMRLPSTEVVPIWHRKNDGLLLSRSIGENITMMSLKEISNAGILSGAKEKKTIARVEWWDREGVKKYKAPWPIVGTPVLEPDYDSDPATNEFSHFEINGQPYNWDAVPIVWCRYNEEELPLQYFIKDLIDDVNWQTSVTADVLRDIAKFIFVLRNYGGQDIGQFTRDLYEALAIEVEGDGGVEKLEPTLNIDAVMAFLEKNRRDLFDYGSGVDTKDPNLGNASGTAINFRYMDLDTDCTALGAELQGAFENMKVFLDAALAIAGKGDFTGDSFHVTFNADMPVNEADIIANIRSSDGIISRYTQLANHPWVDDVEEELQRIQAEKTREMEEFGAQMFAEDFTAAGQQQGGGVNGTE